MSNLKTPVIKGLVRATETPKIAKNPEGYYGDSPSWRFSIADNDHPRWSVQETHEDIVVDEGDSTGTRIVHTFSKSIDAELLAGLKNREAMTWGDILTQNGGRGRNGGTNSHPIPVKDITKEARDRLTELNIITDEVISIRIGSKKRIFGIIEDGIFSIIWFDREHEVCPSKQH